jgi:hypothetical protein
MTSIFRTIDYYSNTPRSNHRPLRITSLKVLGCQIQFKKMKSQYANLVKKTIWQSFLKNQTKTGGVGEVNVSNV